MTDQISMCASNECPRRFECWRYTKMPAAPVQSFADFYKPNAECEYYIEPKEKE